MRTRFSRLALVTSSVWILGIAACCNNVKHPASVTHPAGAATIFSNRLHEWGGVTTVDSSEPHWWEMHFEAFRFSDDSAASIPSGIASYRTASSNCGVGEGNACYVVYIGGTAVKQDGHRDLAVQVSYWRSGSPPGYFPAVKPLQGYDVTSVGVSNSGSFTTWVGGYGNPHSGSGNQVVALISANMGAASDPVHVEIPDSSSLILNAAASTKPMAFGGTMDGSSFTVIRVNPSSSGVSLDPKFGDEIPPVSVLTQAGQVQVSGSQGMVNLSFNNMCASVQDLTYDSRGRLVLVGNVGKCSSSKIVVTRLCPDGTLDQSFGNMGFVFLDVDGRNSRARSIKSVQARYLQYSLPEPPSGGELPGSDGALEGGDPVVVIPDPIEPRPPTCENLEDPWTMPYHEHVYYVGGTAEFGGGESKFVFAKLKEDGSLDEAFWNDGIVVRDFSPEQTGDAELEVIETVFEYCSTEELEQGCDRTKRILGVGSVKLSNGSQRPAILSLTPSGQLDTDFGENGQVIYNPSNDSSSPGFDRILAFARVFYTYYIVGVH